VTQLGLSYTPPFDARLDWERLLAAVRACVDRLTPKEVAHALDVSPTTLCEALANRGGTEDRGRKRLALEWISTILRMAGDDDRRAILEALCVPVGYVPQRQRVLTPAEQLEQLRQHLEREAPGVLRAYDKGGAR
jgi:hypothetical protein